MIAYLFGWPHGQIWPNLIASAACFAAGFAWLQVKNEARHVEAMALANRNQKARLDQAGLHHGELARQLAVHCADIKDHVSAVAVPVPAAVPFAGMSDQEFERQLRALMRSNPKVLDTFLRQQERRRGGRM